MTMRAAIGMISLGANSVGAGLTKSTQGRAAMAKRTHTGTEIP
ncbi:MAG: hypothetical protein SOX43_01890 [Pelistega sp.]|nr:hypothetical protein [Pelistega sp.]